MCVNGICGLRYMDQAVRMLMLVMVSNDFETVVVTNKQPPPRFLLWYCWVHANKFTTIFDGD